MDPGKYVSTYRWRIVAIAAIMGIAGLVLGTRIPPQYESTVLIRLDPIVTEEEDASPEATELDFNTLANMARSVDVERIAAEKLGLENGFSGLAGPLTVLPVGETDLLQFRYQHRDPETAQERAQAFAEAYLEFRERVMLGAFIHRGAELQHRLDVLERDLEAVLERAARADDPARRRSLESFTGVLEGTAIRLAWNLSQLGNVPPTGAIVQPATVRGAPPVYLITAMVGLMFGLPAGIGYAASRSRRDERTMTPERVEGTLGAPVLATIPRVGGWGRDAPLITDPKAAPVVSEAYRILRTNVFFAAEARGARTIVVTSARPGEGKTSTAANLALGMARSGKRVALVSADLRNHRLSELFGVLSSPGLTEVLAGAVPLKRALYPGGSEGLVVLPGGSPTDDPAHLLGSPAMTDVLAALAGQADFVIVDAPPVLGMADAVALAPLADGVLLVVDARIATDRALARARKQLGLIDTQVLGVAVRGRRALTMAPRLVGFRKAARRDAAA